MAGAKFPGLLDLGQPLVGRKREAEAILHQLDVAAAGVTRAVMLGGEPGIGKTRLLDWLAEQGAERGAVILRGGASQAAGMPPYLPILEALGHHVRATEPEVLRTQAGQGAPTLALILPELTAALGDIPPAMRFHRSRHACGSSKPSELSWR